MKKILFLIIIIQSIYPKNNIIPFHTCEVSLGISRDLIDTELNNYYNPKNGLKTGLEFPFYVGSISTNIIFNFYEYLSDTDDDLIKSFIYIHPAIEWNKPLKFLNDKLKWSNGLSLGSYIFYYKENWDKYFTIGKHTETELSIGYTTALNYKIVNNFYLNFYFKKNIIFTYKKINVTSFSIGVSRLVNTPRWLEKILK